MQENSLHLALKQYFAGETGQIEVCIDGYFVDVVQDNLLIEVQTRSFSSIKAKLAVLMQTHKVLLVHPIPLIKWIVQQSGDGSEQLYRRKSPRKGRLEHLFNELVRFPDYMNHPHFSICLVLTHEEEIRRQDGRGSWRRKGASISDRNLLKIDSTHMFSSPVDFLPFLPVDLEQPFTNRQLAEAGKMQINLARKMSYCLRLMGLIEVTGKQQREMLYKLSQPAYNPHAKPEPGANHER